MQNQFFFFYAPYFLSHPTLKTFSSFALFNKSTAQSIKKDFLGVNLKNKNYAIKNQPYPNAYELLCRRIRKVNQVLHLKKKDRGREGGLST